MYNHSLALDILPRPVISTHLLGPTAGLGGLGFAGGRLSGAFGLPGACLWGGGDRGKKMISVLTSIPDTHKWCENMLPIHANGLSVHTMLEIHTVCAGPESTAQKVISHVTMEVVCLSSDQLNSCQTYPGFNGHARRSRRFSTVPLYLRGWGP